MSKFALRPAITRIEDAALVQGAGRYTDDFEFRRGAAHAVLRSPHAHAHSEHHYHRRAPAPGVLAADRRERRPTGWATFPAWFR
jgi:CO/xanthine dehydrogenase Mo-binding subunit